MSRWSRVRAPAGAFSRPQALKPGLSAPKGRVAQMVEHGSNKPRVVGSSPTVTMVLVFVVWRGGGKIRVPRPGLEPGPSG